MGKVLDNYIKSLLKLTKNLKRKVKVVGISCESRTKECNRINKRKVCKSTKLYTILAKNVQNYANYAGQIFGPCM